MAQNMLWGFGEKEESSHCEGCKKEDSSRVGI